MKSKWCAIAPITEYADSFGSLSLPFTFKNGVTIARFPEWARDGADSKLMSGGDAFTLKEARLSLIYDFEAASIGDPHPSSTAAQPIGWQEHASRQFLWTSLALWLARPTQFAYSIVVQFEEVDKGRMVRQISRVSRLLCHNDDAQSRLTMNDVERANELIAVMDTLRLEGTLRLAFNFLYKALIERIWQARYVFLWIVLEGLFGAEDGREITFRLSQRAALFLATDRADRKCISKEMKEGYGFRSKIVHGGRIGKLSGPKSGQLTKAAESSIRNAFNKILLDLNLKEKFDGDQRDAFLDDLAF